MDTGKKKPLIGMIGMGWVGANVARAIGERGYTVIAFDTDSRKPYAHNQRRIEACDIVFVAVPTPTRLTDGGCDDSCVRDALQHVGSGKIAVVKSTIPPGALDALQQEHSDKFLFHSPEFLAKASAAYDAVRPTRNVVGIPDGATSAHRAKANEVLAVLPPAPVTVICSAREASLIKYLSNYRLYTQVAWWNQSYDIAKEFGANWETVRRGIAADPRIGAAHSEVYADGGRGAGGDCFIKDIAALRQFVTEPLGKNFDVYALISAVEDYNIALLRASGKDLDKLVAVYGPEILTAAGQETELVTDPATVAASKTRVRL
ncbi:MAG: NAD(P)-binding domain-containing protein [Patescibacteria group bacterium]|nr:NAD(P)-binding domain-containing protein [Patescibacteria group bacterium]